MAKILCAYSGLEFSVQHFPISLDSRECTHPIFHTTHRRLISYAGRWSAGDLSPEENYLLFLSLLNTSGLVEFRTAVMRTTLTAALVANNMQSLMRITSIIQTLPHPEITMPRFVISPDSCDLANVSHWIESWFSAYKELTDGYRSLSTEQQLYRMEQVLERLIKTPMKTPESYANTLANWAEVAGKFPQGLVPAPAGVGQVSLADYWKTIIRKCSTAESIFHIPAIDLEDLIEHCEDNIQMGSIQATALLTLLRNGRKRQRNYLGTGDDFLHSNPSGFKILDADSSVEDANKLAIIANAMQEAPLPKNFSTRFAYLKAKMAFDMKQQYTSATAIKPTDPLSDL